MAKLKTMLDLLQNGVELVEHEDEKHALINSFSDFCEYNGKYFADNADYGKFEDALVTSIDYVNSIFYEYKDYEPYHKTVVESFLKFKEGFDAELEERPLITLMLILTKDNANCLNTTVIINNIRKFFSTEYEVAVFDFTNDNKIKKYMQGLQSNNFTYYGMENTSNINSYNECINKCKGRFVLNINKNCYPLSSSIKQLINLIKDNPYMGGFLTAELQNEEKNVIWKVLEKDEVATYSHGFKGIRTSLYNDCITSEHIDTDAFEHIFQKIAGDNDIIAVNMLFTIE